ncbi:Cyclin, N-terminal domain family protein [Clavispora lusitaniae]|uniref:Cyclin, N-terminal domain family protein n=1 Tax=Clavispora lusitaniae TaxID=36911 RepID=UPI00202C7496|nr:Cyclin, N-terminal domain family protein [Clavispora lusitaniae]
MPSLILSHHPLFISMETPKPKKYVSADDLYRRSTQYQVWSFTASELERKKAAANEKGRAAAVGRFEDAFKALEAEKPALVASHGAQLRGCIELISLEEEQKYLSFFCGQIVQICTHFQMPTQVKATAISFFKKFYLVNSAMEYRPRNVLYTIVFLAAKSENHFVSIESFCSKIPNTKPQDILELEFAVLQSLRFTLLVHHPFRPLYGFFLDFQHVLLHPEPVFPSLSVDTIGNLYDTAKKWLNDHALLSDASFLFTPPQIALAALYAVDPKLTEKYLRRKFAKERKQEKAVKLEPVKEENESANGKDEPSKENGACENGNKEKDSYDLLLSTIKECIQVAQTETKTSREESTLIDKKCFFALNPAKLLKKKIKSLEEK